VAAPALAVPRIARYTLRRQWPAEVMLGTFAGVFGLAGFAVKRSLGAPEWVVPLITVAGQVPWILAPAWEPLFGGLDRQRAFLWLGLLSKGPLLLVALVQVVPLEGGAAGQGRGDVVLFVVALTLCYVVDAAYIPHRSALIGANYPFAVRGRMFGLFTAVTVLSTILASKAGGRLLDEDPRWLRVLYPVAALVGIAGHVVLSRIRWKKSRAPPAPGGRGFGAAWRAFRRAWRDTFAILRTDAPFRTFESAFMLYGFGLLMSFPIVVLYAEEDLRLSTDEWTWANGFANPVLCMVGIAILGRVSDRLGVIRTTALANLGLGAFFAVLPFVSSPWAFVALFGLYGLSMAGVNVGWNLGPLHFAPHGRARAYMGVHLGLVGLRCGIAPFVGLWIARTTSRPTAFAVSAALMGLAAITQAAGERRTLLRGGGPR
jgi:MFS family permease